MPLFIYQIQIQNDKFIEMLSMYNLMYLYISHPSVFITMYICKMLPHCTSQNNTGIVYVIFFKLHINL